jgi:hypothetical protein
MGGCESTPGGGLCEACAIQWLANRFGRTDESLSKTNPLRLTIATLMLDIETEWTLNASLTTSSSYRKCSKRRTLDHSAQSDISAANRRHDEMLAHSPWFRLWQNVAAADLIGLSAHALRNEALQLRLDGAVVRRHDIGGRFRSPSDPIREHPDAPVCHLDVGKHVCDGELLLLAL